jgi:hypothetical protein
MKKHNNLILTRILFFIIIYFFPLLVKAQQVVVEKNEYGNKVIVNRLNGVASSFPVSFGTGDLSKQEMQAPQTDNIQAFSWLLKFSAPGKVFKDISFANPQVGYIVTELGSVYKTTNGGDNWVSVMNLGFPYYWYGVHALTQDTVIISGFNDQGDIHTGVARWSFNGGTTWTNDITLRIPSGVGWTSRVHFFNANTGIISAEFSGAIHYTTNGGHDSLSWNHVQVNTDLGWFAGNLDAHASGNVYTTGIHFAHSTNYGVNWVSGSSADNTFDGGVSFLDNNIKGWTGGGEISPSVSGWVHRTTDGGQTWSPRLNTFPYPIRAVKFFNDTLGLAIGGSINQDMGGIYSTSNAGTNWNLDVNTSAEMFSFDYKQISADSMDIWCVGSTGGGSGFIGKLYKARTGSLTGINQIGTVIPAHYNLYQNYPNPFNPSTKIRFEVPAGSVGETRRVALIVFDVLGREIAVLVNQQLQPGSYQVSWNAANQSSGIYFYKLVVSGANLSNSINYTDTKKMILIK